MKEQYELQGSKLSIISLKSGSHLTRAPYYNTETKSRDYSYHSVCLSDNVEILPKKSIHHNVGPKCGYNMICVCLCVEKINMYTVQYARMLKVVFGFLGRRSQCFSTFVEPWHTSGMPKTPQHITLPKSALK